MSVLGIFESIWMVTSINIVIKGLLALHLQCRLIGY